MNLRLTGLFTLRSPLSHIGETESTAAFLAQEPVFQPDGSFAEVFCLSGNSWRGQLRDLAATYFLDRLGSPRLSLASFHLLFSGGRIGGEQAVDLQAARQWRQLIPLMALWGGGVGNQILPGKLRVSNAYPVCLEALPALPRRYRPLAASSYRGMTFEKSFSRTDDGKNPAYDRYHHAAVPAEAQPLLPGTVTPEPPKAKRNGPADQMRMTVELIAAGVQLATEITLLDVSEVELGCLTSALHQFSRAPFIGGQSSRGHGAVSLGYTLVDLDSGDERPYLTVDGDGCLLTERAQAAQGAYDQHCRALYDALLQSQASEIGGLLGVAA